MHNRKLESSVKTASRRFGKNTLCTILQGKQLIDFITKNSLLPTGFFISHPQYGLSSTRNRVLAIPQYDMPELERLMALHGIKNEPPQSESKQPEIPNADSNIFQLEKRIKASEPLVEFLKQTMLMVLVSNPRPRMSDLDMVNILIDTVDVPGGITGILVPKSGRLDTNTERSWNE